MFWQDKKVLVTGSQGFVGHSVLKVLEEKRPEEIFTPGIEEYDLTIEEQVKELFEETQPDVVLHLAGRVGGIGANKAAPGLFFYDNLMMGTLVMEYARKIGAKKTVALAAGCGYPKYLKVPYQENDFWSGLPDENSIGYSMAKKMLIIQSWTYRDQYGFDSTILLPANLYGPHDNFNLETSHVVPALIRKFVEAVEKNQPEVIVWGSGKASREFLYVEDTAKVIVDAAEKITESGPFNLGTGVETSIRELVNTISDLAGFSGEITWDSTKPDGQPRRYYDMSRLKKVLGYVPNTPLREGLSKTIEWYKSNQDNIHENRAV
ncbi:GDP-L-fucose synthase [bacterium]|nr:GDP-L-fucose synthase [bacterium]